jgi:short-subunit dehydrogenase
MSGTHPRTLSGRTALITGASGGIGAEIARDLATRGARVVLTARSRDKLESLAAELRAAAGAEAVVIPSDLGSDDGVTALVAAIEASGLQIDILVNKAAAHLIDLDVKALVRLTAHFLPAMKERGAGHIMNISSFMAFVSCPNFALYGAAKAFVRNFTEALDVELRGTGVRAIAVCPGGTRTGFSAAAGQELNSLGERSLMTAEAVAKKSVRKMLAGRRTYIPGMVNVVTRYALAVVPRTFRPGLMGRIMAAGVKRTGAGR